MTPAEARRTLTENDALCGWVLSNYSRRHPHLRNVLFSHREDALQELRLAMYLSLLTFDVGRGVVISTYVVRPMKTCLTRYLLSLGGPVKYVGEESRQRRKPTERTADDEVALSLMPAKSEDVAARLDSEGMPARVKSALLHALRKEGRAEAKSEAFLDVTFGEGTLQGHGDKHGVTKERVRQWLLRVEPHFERFSAGIRKEAA